MKKSLKYEVNINEANETKKEIAKILETDNERLLNKVGAFASLYDISFVKKYKHPIIVQKTEEPGSKQFIAINYNRIEMVAYDMINHLINDCISMGATPLIVQDLIVCGKLDKEIINKLVKALSDACKAQDCILTGGETSEQPGKDGIGENKYILGSSIVGVVEKDKIIDGTKISEGDIVLGLESSGIHTNGYTLVRRIMETQPNILNTQIDNKSFIDVILEPHRCYYGVLKELFSEDIILGLAHITGGGICENLNRILPHGLDAEIDASKYDIPEIFKLLKRIGNISETEMLRTFNLGIGMTIVTNKDKVDYIKKKIEKKGVKCIEIGKITNSNSKGLQKVIIKSSFNW